VQRFIKPVVIFSVFMILWYGFSRVAHPLFLPKPEMVFDSMLIFLQNGMLWRSIVASFTRITIATTFSALLSIPLGLLIANYRIFDEWSTPVTNLIRYIPATVFGPLLIMWLGIGETMKIVFLFVATFFYFLPSVVLAVKETSPDLVDTAYTMGMNSVQVMLRVLLPYSLPSICETFLLMYGIGWTYVIIAELVNPISGLGHIINLGTTRGRTDQVFVGIITIVIISKLFDYLGTKLVRIAFPWKYAREINE
jgi:NitT/TauT family transport system permease protein